MPLFEIPKCFKSIRLADYAPEYKDQHIDVWVNPPSSILLERDAVIEQINIENEAIEAISREIAKIQNQEEIKAAFKKNGAHLQEIGQKIQELYRSIWPWYAKILFIDGSQINEKDLLEIFETSTDTDPKFTAWLTSRAMELIIEHRQQRKN